MKEISRILLISVTAVFLCNASLSIEAQHSSFLINTGHSCPVAPLMEVSEAEEEEGAIYLSGSLSHLGKLPILNYAKHYLFANFCAVILQPPKLS